MRSEPRWPTLDVVVARESHDEDKRMPYHRSAQSSGEDPSYDLEQRVEATDKLVRQTVEYLCRRCPEHLLEVAAHDALLELSPHVEEAIGSLAEIEERRGLSDEELARQRAFTMLLFETR
jgi:hypothetical protein